MRECVHLRGSVHLVLFGGEVFGVGCDFLARSEPGKLDRLFCLLDNCSGWDVGVRGTGREKERGVLLSRRCLAADSEAQYRTVNPCVVYLFSD